MAGALVWVLLSACTGLALATAELTRLRDAFDTDARIAHRLLSQRAAQHDAAYAGLHAAEAGAGAGIWRDGADAGGGETAMS